MTILIMRTIVILTLTILTHSSLMASAMFMIDASAEKLRALYGDETSELRTSSTLTFKTCIDGVECSVVYAMENNTAVSALCLIQTSDLRFIDSIKDFSILLNRVLKSGAASEINMRFNGAEEREAKDRLAHPPNYIRVTGPWLKSYYFTARLDGDNVVDIQKAGINAFSIAVYRNVEVPGNF